MSKPTIQFSITCIPCSKTNFATNRETGANEIQDALLLMAQTILDETMNKISEAAQMMCEHNGVVLLDIECKEELQMAVTGLSQMLIEEDSGGRSMMELDNDGKVSSITNGEAIHAKLSGKRTDH